VVDVLCTTDAHVYAQLLQQSMRWRRRFARQAAALSHGVLDLLLHDRQRNPLPPRSSLILLCLNNITISAPLLRGLLCPFLQAPQV
jgi:hypothetical protein